MLHQIELLLVDVAFGSEKAGADSAQNYLSSLRNEFRTECKTLDVTNYFREVTT